ncbi:unnamed protein product [Ilex paraguariensis]|uniref:Uncharacterized protein n=1 Tax=Ilex paraguariensis TaxID=185542 RepID=A0ABC8R942_9AQUA
MSHHKFFKASLHGSPHRLSPFYKSRNYNQLSKGFSIKHSIKHCKCTEQRPMFLLNSYSSIYNFQGLVDIIAQTKRRTKLHYSITKASDGWAVIRNALSVAQMFSVYQQLKRIHGIYGQEKGKFS